MFKIYQLQPVNLKANQASMSNYDVAIIGLGLSGLTAAYEIISKKENVSVCGIEARDRVGGRLLTLTENSAITKEEVSADVGGQWVCDKQIHVMKMIKLLGISTFKQYMTGKSVLHRRGKVSQYSGIIPYTINWAGLIELQLLLMKMDRYASEIDLERPWDHPRAKEWDCESALSVINKLWTQTARDLLTVFILSVFACEPNEISFLYVLFYIKSSGNVDLLIGM
jgi:monoamine oxidase